MITTRLKRLANRFLRPANLRLESRTADRIEADRLAGLDAEGWFDDPVLPLPPAVAASDPEPVLAAVERYAVDLARLLDPTANGVGYDPANPFFAPPDAEVLYALVRDRRPGRIVEVGSGHSTRVARRAILDGGLDTEIVSIDPEPRAEIDALVDRAVRGRVEGVEADLPGLLDPGDVLFVDSSHEVAAGNDVVRLLLRVLPRLPEGVLVHVHDVFLPYEYPRDWVVERRRPWTEQYLLHALLMGAPPLEVVWAGHWVQRSRVDFDDAFPAADGRAAKSFWLRNGAWPASA